jgi:hypothetical protein
MNGTLKVVQEGMSEVIGQNNSLIYKSAFSMTYTLRKDQNTAEKPIGRTK